MRKLFSGSSLLVLACIVLLSMLTSSPAKSDEMVCQSCNGTGISRFEKDFTPAYNGQYRKEPCSICGGVSRVHVHKPCRSCGGSGRILRPNRNRSQNTYPGYGPYYRGY